MILFLQCSELFKTTILERNFLRAKYRMSVVSTASLIVAPGYGDLVTTNTATYNTTVTTNQTEQIVTLPYDEIFDITLNEADSETFLNAFDISGLKLELPVGSTTQSLGGATAVFRDSSCAEVLINIINNSVNATPNTVVQYLTVKVQEKLTALEATFGYGFAAEIINGITIDLDPSLLTFTLTGPAVNIDVSSSITTIGSKCFGSSSAIVNQVSSQRLFAYDVSGTNHLSTSAFPALKGDQFVFALRITNVDLIINKGTFTSNYIEEPTNLAASVKSSIANFVCAFRFTLDTGGTAFTGLRPY